jgi:hypothetical protein
MTTSLVAEFRDLVTLQDAVGRVKQAGYLALDAFTPYPVKSLSAMLGIPRSRMRMAMFAGGFGIAAFAFALQWYSAAVAYPLNSGGRPLNSWQVFLLVPFEVGVFAAALAGVVVFLRSGGLLRLHHPLFEIAGFERATQDHFFLLAATDGDDAATLDLRSLLHHAGAVVVSEVREP